VVGKALEIEKKENKVILVKVSKEEGTQAEY
jgi:hypothetical protein